MAKKKHGWDKEHFAYHCSDGIHNSFWATVIQSDEWQAWEKIGDKHGFDVDECRACGWISPKHFKEFIKFIKSK